MCERMMDATRDATVLETDPCKCQEPVCWKKTECSKMIMHSVIDRDWW